MTVLMQKLASSRDTSRLQESKENDTESLLWTIHGLPTQGRSLKIKYDTENNVPWQTKSGLDCLDHEV
jgi:hypothetical protein